MGTLIIKRFIFFGNTVSKVVHENLIKGKNFVMNSFIKVPVNKI